MIDTIIKVDKNTLYFHKHLGIGVVERTVEIPYYEGYVPMIFASEDETYTVSVPTRDVLGFEVSKDIVIALGFEIICESFEESKFRMANIFIECHRGNMWSIKKGTTSYHHISVHIIQEMLREDGVELPFVTRRTLPHNDIRIEWNLVDLLKSRAFDYPDTHGDALMQKFIDVRSEERKAEDKS